VLKAARGKRKELGALVAKSQMRVSREKTLETDVSLKKPPNEGEFIG